MTCAMKNPQDIVKSTRTAFNTGATKAYKFRESQLKGLLRFLEENENLLVETLRKECRKPKFEAVLSEIDSLKNDVRNMIFNLKDWMGPEYVEKSLTFMLDKPIIYPEPYGLVLIIGAWNYPFLLTISPLAGAIAAGNCAIIKPSEVAPESAKVLDELLPKYLDNDCYKIYTGGIPETTALLEQKFDYIFYTGNTSVGKIVYEAASKHLTPVTLELGGKSPVYVDSSADIDLAAARIMWGKCLNNGQSCIGPDYILCTKETEKKFVEAAKKKIQQWYGEKIKSSPDYSRIINSNHFKRITKLLEGVTVAMGGEHDVSDLYIEPTIVTNVTPESLIMNEEVFGPVLPILNVSNATEAISFINEREKPLAIYVFSNVEKHLKMFLNDTSSGGVCINDVLLQFSCDTLPFGGVGPSGIGSYHGKFTFDTFSHKKGALIKKLNAVSEYIIGVRYPPYSQSKSDFISMMSKKRPPIPFISMTSIATFGLGVFVALFAKCLYEYIALKQDDK